MKLGELAAELTISRSEIVTFLAKYGTQVEEGSDIDLGEEQVAGVRSHFLSLEQSERSHEEARNNANTEPVVKPTGQAFFSVSDKTDSDADMAVEKVTRIKAPKVALPGLKVVGKIELPTPKPKNKESTETEENLLEEKTQPPVKKEPTRRKKQSSHKPRKSETTRQRRSSPAKKKQKRTTKEKERRAKYYYDTRMKDYSIPIKPLRREMDTDYEVYVEEKEEPPKNWLSKLLHWFTAS